MPAKNYGVPGKADVTSLDEDLRKLRDGKFSKSNIDEIQDWIFVSVLQGSMGTPSHEEDLLELLKDGCVLCEIANILLENDKNDNSNKIKYKQSKMPFVQMEQISIFLNFVKKYGVPQDELFCTIDLFEKTDPAQVFQTMKSLSRYANEKDPIRFPILGPKLSKQRQAPAKPRKPSHLNSTSWSTMEFGYMKGANQKTENVIMGGKRDITRGA